MAGLAFLILMLPYAVLSGIIQAASDSSAVRANLRKDIATILAGALLAFGISGQYTLLKEAFENIASVSSITDEPAMKITILAVMAYMAFQFIKIAFLRLQGDLNILKFFVFVFVMAVAFIFSTQDMNRTILGFQAATLFFSVLGLFSLVFFAGLHAVFAKPILIVNVIGIVISLMEKQALTDAQVLLILQLIPPIPEPYSTLVVVLSTATALYNIAIERGVLSPLPIFAD